MPDLTEADVAGAAAGCQPQDVVLYWPMLRDALKENGVGSRNSQVGLAATVIIESRFRPIREIRANAKRNPVVYGLQEKYWGTGFYGRGFIQRTGELNYRAVQARHQAKFGVDVVANPDALLDPEIAAYDAALFWVDHRVPAACDAGDWKAVRRLVNGRLMLKLTEFLTAVRKMGVAV